MSLLRVLPPVSEPFCLCDAQPAKLVPNERVRYLQSGTAALAFALTTLAQRAKTYGAVQSDVLLPAYVCPDVLSAVLFAGLKPKLVDLAPDACFPSIEHWAAAVDQHTLVVLTVGFLGMRDPFSPRSAGSALPLHVEDCCQVHPGTVQHTEDRTYVYSFGRGKPVSLLHGGAVVFPDRGAVPPLGPTSKNLATLIFRGLAYNVLRVPAIYGWVRRLPGLHLGATVFKPLTSIESMHPGMERRLSVRVQSADARLRRQHALRARLAQLAAGFPIVDLWSRHGTGTEWLLRYPLLLPNRTVRNRALAALEAKGLGASAFYAAALANIAGVALPADAAQATKRAQEFAERLITLPLHDAVRERDIDAMVSTLEQTLKLS